MEKKLQLIVSSIFLLCISGFSQAAIIDDFESGNLDNWTVGGRQLGTHVANVVPCSTGSLCGHLQQSNSFTEINISQNTSFSLADNFRFDLNVDVNQSGFTPSSNYYGIAGAAISFLDSANDTLGSVWYLASTTSYPSTNWISPTLNVNTISENTWHHFDLNTSDLLSQISLDQSQIVSTRLMFQTYSSTWPHPFVSAELFVDNINVSSVPEPSVITLISLGLIGLCITRRRDPSS